MYNGAFLKSLSIYERIKKSGLSKCKIKALKMFSSLVTFIRYAMVLSFLKIEYMNQG